jgi:hypothetical protein
MILKNIIAQVEVALTALRELDLDKPALTDRQKYYVWANKVAAAKRQLENAAANIIGFAP